MKIYRLWLKARILSSNKKPPFLLIKWGVVFFHPYLHPLAVRLLMDDLGFDRNLLNHGGNVNIFRHIPSTISTALVVDKG